MSWGSWAAVLSLLSYSSATDWNIATRRLLSDGGYPKALCLDGSPALYYLSQGSGTGAKKYFIYFEGGGWCFDKSSCMNRASSKLGSSLEDGPTRNISAEDHVKFSRDPVQNPLMHDWNHIFVRYCDGAFYSGDKEEPVPFLGTRLYYRGKHIIEALFADLSSKLESSSDVVLAGCSAGAMHVYAHLDAMRALAPANVRIVGLPQSGYFLDEPWLTPGLKASIQEQNATSLFPPECSRDYAGREELCFHGPIAMKYVQTPIFALQSRFDWARHKQAPACADDACTQEYVTQFQDAISTSFDSSNKGGYFLDSCLHHCFKCMQEELPARPMDDATGLTPLQAFAVWYSGGKAHFSQAPVPECKECCSGKSPAAARVLLP